MNIDGVNECLIVSRLGTSELPEPEKYEIGHLYPRDWNYCKHHTGMDSQHGTHHHARYGHHATAESSDKALFLIFNSYCSLPASTDYFA
jgi:hypothetical protein